jgi:uncharacterized damage-inducible protein DinB
MNKQALQAQRQYFQMVHGVTMRLIASFQDQDLGYHPKQNMRSIKELIYHMYSMEKVLALGIKEGKLLQENENLALPESQEGKAKLAELNTVAALQDYAAECHKALDDAAESMTDEQLKQPLEAPYGTFPTSQFFMFMYDEHWHHRGQLYTYARLIDRDPPMLYDYQ